jgi:hypothetical protein
MRNCFLRNVVTYARTRTFRRWTCRSSGYLFHIYARIYITACRCYIIKREYFLHVIVTLHQQVISVCYLTRVGLAFYLIAQSLHQLSRPTVQRS